MPQPNHPGFSTTLVLTVVAVLAVAGFIGWSIYSGKKQSVSNPTQTGGQTQASIPPTTTPQTAQPAQVDPNAGYFDIKELGIKIKISDSIKDLTYSVQTLGDGSKAASFSTRSLAAIDPNCGTATGPLGAIEMTTVSTDRTGAKKIVDNDGIFKIGDYYYTSSGPSALCSEKIKGVEVGRTAFHYAIKTMQSDQ